MPGIERKWRRSRKEKRGKKKDRGAGGKENW
jgi:hypothetical protein